MRFKERRSLSPPAGPVATGIHSAFPVLVGCGSARGEQGGTAHLAAPLMRPRFRRSPRKASRGQNVQQG
jgi:hypothetical protein